MKKATAIFLTFVLLLSAASCRKIGTAENADTTQSSAVENTTKQSAVSRPSGESDGANRPESWAAKYPEMKGALNEFYIVVDGEANYYFYRNTEDLADWVNSEFNIDGWYYLSGRIISSDGRFAIPEEYERLSPFVTYNAEQYSGPVSENGGNKRVPGTVYALNSCTPFALSGLRLDGDRNPELNVTDLSLKGIRSEFGFGENIMFYIDGINDFDGLENRLINKLKIYCVPHNEQTDYRKMTAAQMAEICAFENNYSDAAQIGSFNFSNSVSADKEKSGSAGFYDIVFMYEDTAAYYLMVEIN